MKSYQNLLHWNLMSLSLSAVFTQIFLKSSQLLKKTLSHRFLFSTPENLLESLSLQNIHLITLNRKHIKAVLLSENSFNTHLLFSSCVIQKRLLGYSVELTANKSTWHNSHYSTRTAIRWLETLTGSLFIPIFSPVFKSTPEKTITSSLTESSITLKFPLCFFRSH